MRILVCQPIQETKTVQLEYDIKNNPAVDIILYPEGYLADEVALENACTLAKDYCKTIVTGYIQDNKNRCLVINQLGEILLNRAKTPTNEELYMPSVVNANGLKIGYLLCREILKGLDGLKRIGSKIDFIAHPIGVGMFSEEQFEEWINRAIMIAKEYNAMIIGTSHADGTLKGYDISLPISYCIDKNGKPLYISKSDLRARIVNLHTKKVQTI